MLLDQLCVSAAAGHRVEIAASDAADACVLVSKAEIESLEKAIEMLSESPTFERVDAVVHQLADRVEAADLSVAHLRLV